MGTGVARAPPPSPRNLADQLTLFEPGWADFVPHTTASPLGFKKLSTPLYCVSLKVPSVLNSMKLDSSCVSGLEQVSLELWAHFH